MRVAVVGAGWAGCAAAVEAARLGHTVTLFEAGRIAGGRARRIASANASQPILDNGQHILIGAYTETLQLLQTVGIDPGAALLRLPLNLQFPDGDGLQLPLSWPAPLDALLGILGASGAGWGWLDKLSLLKTAGRWQLQRFTCSPYATVADLCRGLRPGPMQQLIEPLCVSALNTPANRASGSVFLRVLRDSLFAGKGGSNLLLPQVDLSALLPDAAIALLTTQGHAVQLGVRVQALAWNGSAWLITKAASTGLPNGQKAQGEIASNSNQFDQIILACPPLEAARLVVDVHKNIPAESASAVPAPLSGYTAIAAWQQQARSLQYEAITTVYVQTQPAVQLAQPMLALRSGVDDPAQFVFDRSQLHGPPGLLAFVISASNPDATAAELSDQVLRQARKQLATQITSQKTQLEAIQTVVEKRATFACTPGLVRPAMHIAPGLLACGDYVAGPYPATLEGAVRSGLAAAREIG